MLLERLRQCPHIENNGADDIQVKKMFLLICWGIEVPRLAFVDKTVAAELLLQHVQVIEQIIQFGTRQVFLHVPTFGPRLRQSDWCCR